MPTFAPAHSEDVKNKINAGLSISMEIGIFHQQKTDKKERNSNPSRKTVFEENKKRTTNEKITPVSLEFRRRNLLAKHKAWIGKYRKEGQDLGYSVHSDPMPSAPLKKRNKAIWTVYFAAELAWILMGHSLPENRVNRPKTLKNRDTFIGETFALWKFLNKYIEATAHMRRGPKPDSEKLFKTALAAYVARNRLIPNGGNPKTVPEPRHVQQVWFVIFGENEARDNIKKLLPALRMYLKEFPMFSHPEFYESYERYSSLGRGLEWKYGKAKTPSYSSPFII